MNAPRKRERCPTCHRAMARPIPVKRAKARRGPTRLPDYRRWCRMQPCALCAILLDREGTNESAFDGCFPVDPAHTQNNGTSSKGPDSSCIPLGRKHHDEYDRDRKAFERKYRVHMRELAKESYRLYLSQTQTLRTERAA